MPNTKTNRGFGFVAVIIVVAIVAAVGGGTYYSAKKATKVAVDSRIQATSSVSGNADKTGTSTNALEHANLSEGLKLGVFKNGSIRSLLNVGKDLECTISFSTTTKSGTMKTDGTVFISGNMMRGDFMMSGSAASASDAHMIREGDNVVAWSGKQGAKISLAAVTSGAAVSASSSAQVSLDQNVLYKCTEWNKDAGKFVVPADVKIYDVSSMMMNLKGGVKSPR